MHYDDTRRRDDPEDELSEDAVSELLDDEDEDEDEPETPEDTFEERDF